MLSEHSPNHDQMPSKAGTVQSFGPPTPPILPPPPILHFLNTCTCGPIHAHTVTYTHARAHTQPVHLKAECLTNNLSRST